MAQATASAADKHQVIAGLARQLAQQIKHRLGQRYAMLAAAFHPRCWHCPRLVGEIDFRPARAEGFAGSRRRVNQKLLCPARRHYRRLAPAS
jgi:hypothetical protein